MNINTFGSEEKFKMLVCVNKNIDFLPQKRRNYISKILTNLNEVCNEFGTIKDNRIADYTLKSLKKDYDEKLNSLIDENVIIKFYNDYNK